MISVEERNRCNVYRNMFERVCTLLFGCYAVTLLNGCTHDVWVCVCVWYFVLGIRMIDSVRLSTEKKKTETKLCAVHLFPYNPMLTSRVQWRLHISFVSHMLANSEGEIIENYVYQVLPDDFSQIQQINLLMKTENVTFLFSALYTVPLP